MGDVKRWLVTYTKQVKQKRKVYQDGSLHLLSNNKVVLYDESEQLLDSRFLTKDDVMRSGESLTFASFLVDIGDPESNPNPISHPKTNVKDENRTPEKTKLQHGPKSSNTFSTKGKPNAAREKTKGINVSPSQKIIREFKKNEMLKYTVQQSSPSATTPSFKEWEALYTTQITQKSKKYHDGILRMVICGSQGRQVMLYDSSKNQLDKRFLKKDEAISCGKSLTFDGYLVDIGDPLGDNEDDRGVEINGRNCKITDTKDTLAGRQLHNLFVDNMVSNSKRSKASSQQDHLGAGNFGVIGQSQHDAGFSKCAHSNLHALEIDMMELRKSVPSHTPLRDEFKKDAHQSHPSASTSSFKDISLSSGHVIVVPFRFLNNQGLGSFVLVNDLEWKAMYTKQITQKAKKYHDGFIRVVLCGSQGRQVTLYDSSKDQLDKRFLKQDETISSGQSLKFAAYLVDIGDPMQSNEIDTDFKIHGSNWKMTVKTDTPAVQQLHNSFVGNCVSDPPRSKVSARQDHPRAGDSVVIGQPQDGAGSGKHFDSNMHCMGVDQRKRVPSNMPLRDAHQILSNLKKPEALDRTLILEDTPVMQCLSQKVQLDNPCREFQGSLPVDPHPAKRVVEKLKDEKAGNEGYTRKCKDPYHDDLPTLKVNANSTSQNIERPDSTQGIQHEEAKSNSFGTPSKKKPMVGSEYDNKLQASLGSSVILQITPDLMSSLSSLSRETGSHHYQPHPTMREMGPKTKEQSAPTSDTSRSKCSAEDPGNIRMNHPSKIESNETLDRPSFDLGF